MPHEITANQEDCYFKGSSSLILSNNNESFLDQIMRCDEKWVLYDNQWWSAQCLTKKKLQSTSQSQTCTKKKGHGHCLVVCSPSDPLQLSESWQNHYIWEVFSANWWDALKTAMPAASIGQQKGPNSSPWQCSTTHCTINASTVEQIGLQSFASSTIFTWRLTKWLPLLQASW